MFITGTNTNIGKTIVTGLIARYFQKKNNNTITQKWIQTGNQLQSEDILLHYHIMGLPNKTHSKHCCPYLFKFPASAHLAANLEKKSIDIKTIKKAYHALKKEYQTVIVEGLGGIAVPINSEITTLDLVKELKLPTIIVFGNELGTINHTLLTVKVLQHENIPIVGLIYNHIHHQEHPLITNDNPKIIETLTNLPILAHIPYINTDITKIHKEPCYDQLCNSLDKIYNK